MTNQSFIRNMNERRILTLLRREGSLSRAEIARRLSLTRSAMTYLVEGLMATSLVARPPASATEPDDARCRPARRGAVAQPDRQLFPGRRDRRAGDALCPCRHDHAAGEDRSHRSARPPTPAQAIRSHPGISSTNARRTGATTDACAPSASPCRAWCAATASCCICRSWVARRQFPGGLPAVLPRSRQHRKQRQCGSLRRGVSPPEIVRRPHPVPEARQWLRRRRDHQRPAVARNQRRRHRVRPHARRRRRPAMPLRTDRLPRNACQSGGARRATLPRKAPPWPPIRSWWPRPCGKGSAPAVAAVRKLEAYLAIGMVNLTNIFNPSDIVLGGMMRPVLELCLDRLRQAVAAGSSRGSSRLPSRCRRTICSNAPSAPRRSLTMGSSTRPPFHWQGPATLAQAAAPLPEWPRKAAIARSGPDNSG